MLKTMKFLTKIKKLKQKKSLKKFKNKRRKKSYRRKKNKKMKKNWRKIKFKMKKIRTYKKMKLPVHPMLFIQGISTTHFNKF